MKLTFGTLLLLGAIASALIALAYGQAVLLLVTALLLWLIRKG